jgi:ribosomal protein S27E
MQMPGMEKPLKNPKCPSCGNELFEKTDSCPFCGEVLPRLSILSHSGSAKNQQMKIVVLISASLVIMGAAGAVFFAMQDEKGDSSSQQIPERQDSRLNPLQQCRGSMNRILDTEDEYMARYGSYTDDIEALIELDPSLDTACPACGEQYTIALTKHGLEVSCPVHGEF